MTLRTERRITPSAYIYKIACVSKAGAVGRTHDISDFGDNCLGRLADRLRVAVSATETVFFYVHLVPAWYNSVNLPVTIDGE